MANNNLYIKKEIDAYVKGTLREEQIMALWVEFAKNPELLKDLETEVGVKKILTEQPEKKTQSNILALPSWVWTAAAAAVILIIGFVQLFKIPSTTSMGQLLVTAIPKDQLETSDGIRAKDQSIFIADSILNLGFNEYVSGNTAKALELYQKVIAEYDYEPYGSKAYLNTGIIYYNEAEYNTAIDALSNALERVEDSRMIEEKAAWFLANALVNLSKFEEAREAAALTYSLDGVYRKPSFLLLQKLNYDLGYSDVE